MENMQIKQKEMMEKGQAQASQQAELNQKLETVKGKLASKTEWKSWLAKANQIKQSSGEESALDLEIEENADMAAHTSFRAGGRAALLITVGDARTLGFVLSVLSAEEIPHIFLGNGSNVLFRDEGYAGAVIKMRIDDPSACLAAGTSPLGEARDMCCSGGLSIAAESAQHASCTAEPTASDTVLVTAQCGIGLGSLARRLAEESLTGFEFASGIPGTLGGALFMNAGAYGGEMKDVVVDVTAISADGSQLRTFTNEEMQFSYRHSCLQENGFIALSATLALKHGDHEAILEQMRELATKRNTKQPVQYPSAGSTFKRPEGYFAGKLIEDAGLKGVSVGGAEVSTLHAGFVINKGGATATDILELIRLVQNTVYDKFGVALEPEVRII